MGAGYASTSRCSGSGLYLIDLEAGSELTEEIDDSGTGDDRGLTHEAGRLYGLFTGSETVSGAVRFLDSEPKDDADESTIVKESSVSISDILLKLPVPPNNQKLPVLVPIAASISKKLCLLFDEFAPRFIRY